MTRIETDEVYRGNLDKLLTKINQERGLDLSQYRRPYVERRLAARLRMLGLHSYRQYSRYLDEHPEEYAGLLDTLTINVTDFYRDPTVYTLFRGTIIPSIVNEKLTGRQRMIRAWSAGCATGEEPYSIAMSFLDAIEGKQPKLLLSVMGTDIDPSALTIAKRGTYDIAKLRQIPHTHRLRYVEVSGNTFTFNSAVKEHVRFSVLNLFEDKPINVVDVIFCRNVFIYFDRDQQEQVLEKFWSALYRGGYLVLGRSEKLAPAFAGRFELVSGKERVYRKPKRP